MAYGARDIPVPTRGMTGTRGREWAKGPAPAGIPALRATPDTGVHLPGLGWALCERLCGGVSNLGDLLNSAKSALRAGL